ncbi:MAG: hypothetical protein Q9170_000410 [Blastenia crenularia]
MLEARLLHFFSHPTPATGTWRLSHPTRKGIPIDTATLRTDTAESLIWKNTFRPGFLEAVTDVVGEGGKVHSFGQNYKDGLGAQNAVVVVVKEMEKEQKDEKPAVAQKTELVMKEIKKRGEEETALVKLNGVSKKEKKRRDHRVRIPAPGTAQQGAIYTPYAPAYSPVSPNDSPISLALTPITPWDPPYSPLDTSSAPIYTPDVPMSSMAKAL